ncbi:hypothetical protein CJ030_MR7G000362 [Morella rubra]|uniref:Exostosin GT47 domain-containing protein n=1 Tax=Morella rubra TaxID=262757 RepID=A0A6A1V4I7_9ROSI|nr:hypothetical protein CJ030_MR0G000329 [Morella rubra]KAB1207664.1 hypothetical protein CJ030_MR7G000362 [Morella rubra]
MKRKPARFQSSFPSSLVTADAATPPTRTKSETIVDKVEFRLSESGSEFLGNGKPAPFQSPFPSGFVSADAVPPPTRTGGTSSEFPRYAPSGTSPSLFLAFFHQSSTNDPRVHSEASIAEFVAQYTSRIRSQFAFWNASAGADHFYVHCHSVGRDAASRHQDLQNNAIQVWPRRLRKLSPPRMPDLTKFQSSRDMYKYLVINLYSDSNFRFTVVGLLTYRHKLAYFAGRIQNSRIRQELIDLWGNDSSMEIFSGSSSFSYEEGFRRSKYCLHVKGYEVNTARVSDAIHYGCIPVIISNHYELPLANVLDWSKFSVIINNGEISSIKKRLLSITKQMYLTMFHNLRLVRKHFSWRKTPSGFDSFHMTAYQLWLRRSVHRLPH